MAVLRFIASLFLIVAVIALVSDVTVALNSGALLRPTAFSGHWADISPGTFNTAKSTVSQLAGPWLWDATFGLLFSVPTFVLFTLLSVVTGMMGRRRSTIRVFVN
jgi:hypothetical protein